MAEILVRDLDEDVVERLKLRAEREGRSLQAEAKVILEEAARLDDGAPKLDMAAARELADRIREGFKGRKMANSLDLIREGRE